MAKRQIGFNPKTWFGNTYKAITKPVDGTDDNTLNITLFNQSFLNNLANQCVPVAGGAEFQVHYRALQIVISKEGLGRIVYTIPTVFFNFNQTVTSGSVDYDLVEVDKISKELQPQSMEVANQVAAIFPKAFFEEKGFEVTFREDEVGSIHRHPGDFSFSSIDLDNNPKHPGVIYRRGNAEDLIQTDSVMYITGVAGAQHVKLVTTQTRVVNVKLVGDAGEDGIEGSYDRAKTVALILKDTDTAETIVKKLTANFNAFFIDVAAQTETVEVSESRSKFLARFDKIKEDDIQEVLENTSKIFQLISMKTTPINVVDEKMIKPRHYGNQFSGGYGNSYGGYKPKRYDHITGTWVEDTDDDDAEQLPKKFDVLDYLLFKEVIDKDNKILKNIVPMLKDPTFIKELYWMCGGKDCKTVFKINGKNVEISEINKTSQLLKVVHNGTTTYQSKSIFDNVDISDELIAAGFVDAEAEEDDFDTIGMTPAEEAEEELQLQMEDAEMNSQSKPTEEGNNFNYKKSEDLLIKIKENKIKSLIAGLGLPMPEKLLKDVGKHNQCELIFKKSYPGYLWDNNGLLKAYHDDGFGEIAQMLPDDTGIIFYPDNGDNNTDAFVYIEPIEEGDTEAAVHFSNSVVQFDKRTGLYQQ
jgi:acetolactate synthase small subunit